MDKPLDIRIPSNRMWNAREVAYFLDISERETYELTRKGILPASKCGRRWIYSPAKIKQWAGFVD